MEKAEKSIHRIGIYFLALGFISAFLTPLYFSSYFIIVWLICIILMCAPRLMRNNKKKWASLLLLICCIVTTFALLYFDALLIILSHSFKQMDVNSVIILTLITTILLYNCYLCFRLYKLLFKTH